MENYFYEGRLPHWQVQQGTFFITYRLAGSIPKALLNRLRAQYLSDQLATPQEKKQTQLQVARTQFHIRKQRQKINPDQFFQEMDDYLDQQLMAPYWLSKPEVALITARSIHYFDAAHYTLWAYCIMSNHVHLIISLYKDAPPLWKLLQRIKRYSSRQSNLILGRQGSFWQKESYDHLVRQGEFHRLVRYTLNNPVKAGMVRHWSEHPWSYCQPSLLENLRM